MAGRKPRNVPDFKWIKTVMGNRETSLSEGYHAFAYRKYSARYLAGGAQPLRSIRQADVAF
jgi:hypothetical protein